MGDRCVVFMIDEYKSNGEVKHLVSPGIYLHWCGNPDQVRGFLKQALPRMRHGDASYSAARFCGACHEIIEGNISLGIFNAPETLLTMDDKEIDEYFGCDNGIYLVDVGSWIVEQRGMRRSAKFRLDKAQAGEGCPVSYYTGIRGMIRGITEESYVLIKSELDEVFDETWWVPPEEDPIRQCLLGAVEIDSYNNHDWAKAEKVFSMLAFVIDEDLVSILDVKGEDDDFSAVYFKPRRWVQVWPRIDWPPNPLDDPKVCPSLRVDLARKALESSPYDSDDRQDKVVDLMADMMHLAVAEGWEFSHLYERAVNHFEAEVADAEAC